MIMKLLCLSGCERHPPLLQRAFVNFIITSFTKHRRVATLCAVNNTDSEGSAFMEIEWGMAAPPKGAGAFECIIPFLAPFPEFGFDIVPNNH